ncbi:MAG: CvpA family protein [Rhodoferax sp.]|nr:CvpA family protein [Rhodoferax sp.]
MPTLDWIFATVLLLSMALGGWRGLVVEVLSLVNWAVAFVAAQWLALDVSRFLPISGASEVMRYALGFVLVFVVAAVMGGLLVVLIRKLTEAVGLRPIDRVLGLVFGLTRGVLLLLVVTLVVTMTPLRENQSWKESNGASLCSTVIAGLKPVLPQGLARYLRT